LIEFSPWRDLQWPRI